jgi:hypothetical protein
MQITLNDKEINTAIKYYLEGMGMNVGEIDVSIIAGRGGNGDKAEISLRPGTGPSTTQLEKEDVPFEPDNVKPAVTKPKTRKKTVEPIAETTDDGLIEAVAPESEIVETDNGAGLDGFSMADDSPPQEPAKAGKDKTSKNQPKEGIETPDQLFG